METNNKRILYLEALRVIAIFMVLLTHTQFFFQFLNINFPDVEYWIGAFISVFIKVAVFLFLSVSGAVLLNRDESIKKVWLKRISKMSFILILFTYIFYLMSIKSSGSPFVFRDFMYRLYTKNYEITLWFLYVYIAFLIILPLLRCLVKNMENKHFYYLIVLVSVYDLIRSCEYIFLKESIHIDPSFDIVYNIRYMVLYPCIGYFLAHRIDIHSFMKKVFPFIFCLTIISIVAMSYFIHLYHIDNLYNNIALPDIVQKFNEYFNFFNVIMIFALVKYIFTKFQFANWINKIIYSVGSCAFGIYLINYIVLGNKYLYLFRTFMIRNNVNYMVREFMIAVFMFVVSYPIVYILKKVPIVKKLI